MLEPRKIYFDGKYIGEVPQTGDQETDLKAMSKLLNERGHLRPTRDQAMFGQAAAFADNAAHLFRTGLAGIPPPRPANVIPFAVNAALAAELYLKTLGHLHGVVNMRGHDLLRLFDRLPAEAKERLRQEIAGNRGHKGPDRIQNGNRTSAARFREVALSV
jgi:hypothetical protein